MSESVAPDVDENVWELWEGKDRGNCRAVALEHTLLASTAGPLFGFGRRIAGAWPRLVRLSLSATESHLHEAGSKSLCSLLSKSGNGNTSNGSCVSTSYFSVTEEIVAESWA